MALQHLINHISLVVDKSSSMDYHTNKVVEVFDRELNALKQRSVDAHQETRISIYLFSDPSALEVLTFDMDVMRFTSLKSYYKPYGNTALLDAVAKSIEDHKKLPELYGDHAFLTYVITDGQENRSREQTPGSLTTLLNSLKDNWTTALLVPDQQAVNAALRFGFNAGSISTWNTNSKNAVEEVGISFASATTSYMAMRSTGVRGTKNLFDLNPANLNASTVNKTLTELPTSEYEVIPVRISGPKIAIKDYVESWTKQKYRLGSAYYQPTKPVEVQDYKRVMLQDVRNGKVYEGVDVRRILGLPDYTVEINPLSHPDYRLFVQSTSVNRNLFPNTFLLIRR